MPEIIVWQEHPIAESNVAEQLRAHITSMRLAAAVAKAGMDGVSDIHAYAAFTGVASLAAGEAVRKQMAPDQGRSPLDEATYLFRNKKLLDTLNRIAEISGEVVVDLANNLPWNISSTI
jgi:hypothetical protein